MRDSRLEYLPRSAAPTDADLAALAALAASSSAAHLPPPPPPLPPPTAMHLVHSLHLLWSPSIALGAGIPPR